MPRKPDAHTILCFEHEPVQPEPSTKRVLSYGNYTQNEQYFGGNTCELPYIAVAYKLHNVSLCAHYYQCKDMVASQRSSTPFRFQMSMAEGMRRKVLECWELRTLSHIPAPPAKTTVECPVRVTKDQGAFRGQTEGDKPSPNGNFR